MRLRPAGSGRGRSARALVESPLCLAATMLLLLCAVIAGVLHLVGPYVSPEAAFLIECTSVAKSAHVRVPRDSLSRPSSSMVFWPDAKAEENAMMDLLHSQKLAEFRPHNFVLLAVANHGNLEFALNWALSLLANGFEKFAIVCLDPKLFATLYSRGLGAHVAMVPRSWLSMASSSEKKSESGNSDEAEAAVEWGSLGYELLTQHKLSIQYEILLRNFSLVYSDVDLVFTSPYTLKHLRFLVDEVIIDTELVSPDPTNLHLYDFYSMMDSHHGKISVNTGFFLALSTDKARNFFSLVLKYAKSSKELAVDQAAFNFALSTLPQSQSLFNVYALDPLLYLNGNTMLFKRASKILRICPLVAHFNFLIGVDTKRKMMQYYKMWYLP